MAEIGDALKRQCGCTLNAVAGAIEREAGHVLISLALIAIGAALWKCGVPKGEDLIPFALGVLGRSMIGQKGNTP